MRRLINSTFVTLDGVVNHMDQWHFDFVDDNSDDLALRQLRASDALLMGRHTYQVYAATWPDRDGEYADRINAVRKYVVSTRLTEPTWENTAILTGDLLEQVRSLKEEDGAAILMHGVGPVAKALLGAGLLDELHLWYHPVFAGVGGSGDLLHTEGLSIGLRHVDTSVHPSGVVVLSYDASPGSGDRSGS
jgi:dihydrofolate reductase